MAHNQPTPLLKTMFVIMLVSVVIACLLASQGD